MKKYSYEECKEIALRYETRLDLKNEHKNIYQYIIAHKWHELLNHMKSIDHKNHVLTYEYCKEQVEKCVYLKDLRENHRNVRTKIRQMGWDDLLKTLKPCGGKYVRCIYAYEFEQLNSVYVGLTYNISIRNKEHHLKGTLYEFAKNNNVEIPAPKILEENIRYDLAGEREGYYMKKYAEEGWGLINKAKAGSIGGDILKKERIVCFDKDGNLLRHDDIGYFINVMGIKRQLIRICLRKTNKSTGGLRFYTEEEWKSNGSPSKITPLRVSNEVKKVIVVDQDFNEIKTFESKHDCMVFLGYANASNNVARLRELTIITVKRKWRLCYLDDYIKYKNGEYIIYKPDMPKCKKMVFIDKNASEEENKKVIDNVLSLQKWEINQRTHQKERKALSRKPNKKKDPNYIFSYATPVLKISLDGKILERFKSISEAEKNNVRGISNCTRELTATCGGFIWIKEKDLTTEYIQKRLQMAKNAAKNSHGMAKKYYKEIKQLK